MAGQLYGLTASHVDRLRRVLNQANVPDLHAGGRGTRRPPQWEPRLGYGTTTVAPGGSAYFNVRRSTAIGSSETLTGYDVLAQDWCQTGATSGDRVLLFKPNGARWYFLKPGSGGSGATPYWGKVSVGPSTRVTSGFGSTQVDWLAINPCADAAGNSVDTGTTYVVVLPDVGVDSAPYNSTGDVIAYIAASGGANVPVTQYATPRGSLTLYSHGQFTNTFNDHNVLMDTTASGGPSQWSDNNRYGVTIDGTATTFMAVVAKQRGIWMLSYAVQFELENATSIVQVESFLSSTTGALPSSINSNSVRTDWQWGAIAGDQMTVDTHTNCILANLTTSNKVTLRMNTYPYTGPVRIFASHLSMALVHASDNSHF